MYYRHYIQLIVQICYVFSKMYITTGVKKLINISRRDKMCKKNVRTKRRIIDTSSVGKRTWKPRQHKTSFWLLQFGWRLLLINRQFPTTLVFVILDSCCLDWHPAAANLSAFLGFWMQFNTIYFSAFFYFSFVVKCNNKT